MNHSFIKVFATCLGLGFAPKAPGTVGTLAALPLIFLGSLFLNPMVYMMIVSGFILFAIFISHSYEVIFCKRDPPEIVIDEVAGFLVAMLWIPWSWQNILLGFILFRLLDIFKPFPINYVERNISGGLGVVADDLVAGTFTNICLHILLGYGFL